MVAVSGVTGCLLRQEVEPLQKETYRSLRGRAFVLAGAKAPAKGLELVLAGDRVATLDDPVDPEIKEVTFTNPTVGG